jgi:hypothetical protein
MMNRTRTTLVVALAMVLASCAGPTSPTGSPTATLPGASSPARSAPDASPIASGPAGSASATAVGSLPIGQIVFDRLEDNPEGRLVDMFTLGTDGEEHAMKIPVLLDFASGVWSNDGRKLLVNSFSSAIGSSVGIHDLGTGGDTPIARRGWATASNAATGHRTA